MTDQTSSTATILMTPNEVAFLFRVDPKTVTRWAVRGWLPSTKTPGGHRRFNRADVEQVLREGFRRG